MGRRQGFSLVELLVVMAVFSLLASFSLPSLANFKDMIWLDLSAREAASELRKTQARAMAENEARSWGRFEFSASGFTPPGGSGTELLTNNHGQSRKIIVSTAGRVRIE